MKQFTPQLERALATGLAGVALVDRDGRAVGLAGAISVEEAKPLASLVMVRLKSENLAERLFAGEIVTLALDDREIAVGVARRQLFVVAVLGTGTADDVRALRAEITEQLTEDFQTPLPSGGGSGGGPADLPLIELGITVPRAKA